MSQQPRIPYFQKIVLDLLPGYLGKAFDQLTSYWNDHDTGTKQWTVVNTASLTVGSALSLPSGIVGVTDGSSATAGNVGETMESSVGVSIACGATTVWTNLTSLPLTPGDWDVCGVSAFVNNGATMTGGCQGGISLFSGATTTDMVNGKNIITILPPTVVPDSSAVIPRFIVRTSVSATAYLKGVATYSAGAPRMYGYISARRTR
jgi:hypothetical protein